MSKYELSSPPLKGQYIAFPKAMKQLAKRLKALREELAVWVFLGPELGGLTAYRNANELDPPPEFYFDPYVGDDPDCRDYLSPLTACWFRQQDILNFTPTQRYTTGAALIDRWSELLDMQPEVFIRAKIEESRLQDIHPISGVTQGRMSGDEWYPPMSDGLFALSEIEAIEKEDFDFADAGELEIGSPEWRSQNARKAANARHDRPGGSRDRQQQIRAIWAKGNYTSRDRCAEEECADLGMSYSAARRALRKTPDPTRST